MHQDELLAASSEYQLLFEESPDILLVLLPDAPRFTMVAATNARFVATHTTRETLGRSLFEVFPDNPDDIGASGSSNLRASLGRVLATRKADTMAVQKYDIRGPDGSYQSKYWSPKNIPILFEGGEVKYILHCVEDVTELVEASELGHVLRDRSKQMEREVVARSRELADANRSLREANAKLGEVDVAKMAFFSNVSHEFRTPLTLILGPVEAALGRQSALLSMDELSALHRNALRLLRLVNNLLDFSRIEMGVLNARFEPTDLASLTASLVAHFQSLFDDAGVLLVSRCGPLPQPIHVDRGQWEKIVLNLISNAFKFTLAGEVEVSLESCEDHVELRVRDSGTGIPEAELPRIFERFHRVEGTLGRSYEGSGIGLALVHEFAQQHGGSVRVQSKPGQGSLFTVAIPVGFAHLPPDCVVDESGASSSEHALRAQLLEAKRWHGAAANSTDATQECTPTTPSGKRGRVLVADDNADMRDYITSLLASRWDVQTAANGETAFAAALAAAPDLVLSDMMMPRMNGVELLAALRANELTSTIPVILISARAGEEARLEGLETGADDYLVKPFSARELVTRISTHLAMAKARRAAAEAARELAETRGRMASELEQKNRDLQVSYETLRATQAQLVQSAKMASLGQLVAGIAHEINNPLAFVLGHLNTAERSLGRVQAELGRELPDGTSADWRRALDRIQESSNGLQRLQELVLKLRTFSRLDEGERKCVSLRESVASVLAILQHRLREGVEVSTNFEGPDAIDCYAGLLNQALMNLLTNAIDAIPDRGHIEISTWREADFLVLAVTDSGIGIPDENRERVFEPFFTTKPVGQGTGLGLSITYAIVQKHRGRLTLLPGEHGGTRAVVHLPFE